MGLAGRLSEMTLEELWQLFPIILTPYNPGWKDWYREQQAVLFHILPAQQLLRISHVGSTAIGTIWAKPTVDILVEVRKDSDLEKIAELLNRCGYMLMSRQDNRMSFNLGYTETGFAEKVFHLHLRLEGDHDELYFRDFLIEYPETAKEYEQLKLSLWKQFEHDRDGYTEAKTAFVRSVTEKAKQLYVGRYETDLKRGSKDHDADR